MLAQAASGGCHLSQGRGSGLQRGDRQLRRRLREPPSPPWPVTHALEPRPRDYRCTASSSRPATLPLPRLGRPGSRWLRQQAWAALSECLGAGPASDLSVYSSSLQCPDGAGGSRGSRHLSLPRLVQERPWRRHLVDPVSLRIQGSALALGSAVLMGLVSPPGVSRADRAVLSPQV